MRAVNGSPAQFTGRISSNYLPVGGLLVSNTWVFGNVMDLVASPSNGVVLVTVFCRPLKTYLLLASTNFLEWIPVATNTPAGSQFDYLDSTAPIPGRRYFRAAMLEPLLDRLGLALNPADRRATLNLQNVRPNHTLILQASADLRHWTALSTNNPVAITDWPFLDTNAPSFDRRFYRAVGQGK